VFNFYGLREIFVTTPNGDHYELGSATRIFMADSSTADGIGPVPMSPGGYAPQLSLGKDDSFSLPFGPSLVYPLSFTSVDAVPTWLPALSAYTTNPETPYFWWRTAVGGVSIPNQRIDLAPSPAPTGQAGTYHVDLEGNVFCSNGTTVPFSIDSFFDIGNITFTATTTTTTTSTSSSTSTSTTRVGVPEFPAGNLAMAVLVAVTLAGLLVIRKRAPGLPVN